MVCESHETAHAANPIVVRGYEDVVDFMLFSSLRHLYRDYLSNEVQARHYGLHEL